MDVNLQFDTTQHCTEDNQYHTALWLSIWMYVELYVWFGLDQRKAKLEHSLWQCLQHLKMSLQSAKIFESPVSVTQSGDIAPDQPSIPQQSRGDPGPGAGQPNHNSFCADQINYRFRLKIRDIPPHHLQLRVIAQFSSKSHSFTTLLGKGQLKPTV